MENLRLKNTTKAPNLIAVIQKILEIIIEHDEASKRMVNRAEKNGDAETNSITAKLISRIQNKTEEKLNELETVEMKSHLKQLMKKDGMEIFRNWMASFMKKTEYITFKEMGRMDKIDLMKIMKFYVELIKNAHCTHIYEDVEVEDQYEHINLITKYRIMLKYINGMDTECCLEVQKIFSKDYIPGDHYKGKQDIQGSINLSPEDTQSESSNVKENKIAEVTHRTSICTNTSSIDREDFPHILVQTEEDKPQTGQWERIMDHTELKLVSKEDHLKRKEPEKVNLDMSGLENKGKKESSELITLATKSEKRGLNCSVEGCNYIVTITNKGKARKKIRKHKEETHIKKVIETKITDKEHSNKNITNKSKQDTQGLTTPSSLEDEAHSEPSHVKEASVRSLNHQLNQVRLTAQKRLGKDNLNWGLMKHDAWK